MNDWHFPRGGNSSEHETTHSMGHERSACAPDPGTTPTDPPSTARAAAPPIFEALLTPSAVATAWDRVRRNDGAPGVDGRRIADVAPVFHLEWPVMESALRRGQWRPQPVRRVAIPKAGGGTRTLGIPAVTDRVVHQLITQALTPLWEPRFSPRSFAYRQGRGVREALLSVTSQANSLPSPWAWHLDIRQFFDRVPREQALRALRRVTDDARLCDLVERILDAGAFERGQVVPTPRGLPQGSPLSPLLANAVLHPLDLWLTQEMHAFMRYADDITILLPSSHARNPPQHEVNERLTTLGLELNTEKTCLYPLAEAACLGFSFWQDTAGRWRTRISPAAWAALEAELHRRHSLLWSTFGTDDGAPHDYLTGWLCHYGATDHPEDHCRIAQLRASLGIDQPTTQGNGRTRPSRPFKANPVHIPYDGHVSASPPHPTSSGTSSPHSKHSTTSLWQQTLRVWWLRLKTGRLVRVGLDFSRQRRHLFPRPTALRLTLLGFTFRLRL
jgi:RNA-directed DNA polymerase